MIALSSDFMLFEMSSGESVPFSAEMISVELTGEAAHLFDPELVKHASAAVFHYFRHELGRITVSVGEFTLALEKVLRGFALKRQARATTETVSPANALRKLESDLRQLAAESTGSELFFFPRLRDELRARLRESPETIHFRGLRGCVKELTGARRWTTRCQNLHDRIVDYLRGCLSAESPPLPCALVVE